jgi:hypothetical protein
VHDVVTLLVRLPALVWRDSGRGGGADIDRFFRVRTGVCSAAPNG